jgi:hypothetical protein
MFYVIRGFIICLLMLLPTSAWAANPLGVEDSATEGTGNYLFELNGDYVKNDSFKTTTLAGALTYGATEHIDFSVEVPYVTLNPSPVTDVNASGIGDVRIAMKQQLFENEVKQSMAYKFTVDMPTGDSGKGLGMNNVVAGITLIDSQECHDNVFHVSVGYEVYGRDVKKMHFAKDSVLRYALAAEHKMSDSFRLLAEIAGENRKEEGNNPSRPFTFLAGFIYDISKSWYVDLGARAGLNKAAEDHAVLAGTAWRF